MANPVILVVGAGPGVGSAVARRFGMAGYDVALIARSATRLQSLGESLQADGITTGWTAVDVTDAAAFSGAVSRFGGHAGHIDVLHFNPSATTMKSPIELSPDELLADVNLGVASLLTAVQTARPFMPAGARVTVTGSGTADRPWTAAASVGVQKAALRNLVGALGDELKPHGVRAVTVTVRGLIKPGGRFDPAHVADATYTASTRPDADWTRGRLRRRPLTGLVVGRASSGRSSAAVYACEVRPRARLGARSELGGGRGRILAPNRH